jgi:hypothetical protein
MRNIPKIDDWGSQLQTIRSSDKACRKFTQRFDSKDQRIGMTSIEDLVKEHANTTKNLLQAFNHRFDQSKEIILWVSKADVESDHNRVREKLGYYYRDSGQWLRSRYHAWIASTDKSTFWLCGSGI